MLLIIFGMGGMIIGMKWAIRSSIISPYGYPPVVPGVNGQGNTSESWSSFIFLLAIGAILIAGFWIKNQFEGVSSKTNEEEEPNKGLLQDSVSNGHQEETIAKMELKSSVQAHDLLLQEAEIDKNDQVIHSPNAGVYYIQVGAFNNWGGVVARRSAWHGYQGKEALVYGPNESGQYKVWLGPFRDKKAVNQFIEEFDIPGFPTSMPE